MVFRMRAHTHGDWAQRQRVKYNLFDTEKFKVFLELLTGFEPSTFGSPLFDSEKLQVFLELLTGFEPSTFGSSQWGTAD